MNSSWKCPNDIDKKNHFVYSSSNEKSLNNKEQKKILREKKFGYLSSRMLYIHEFNAEKNEDKIFKKNVYSFNRRVYKIRRKKPFHLHLNPKI